MTLPQHLASIVLAIRTALSAYAGRTRAHGDLLLLVWGRAGRTAARLERLFALWQQGTLKPIRPRAQKPKSEPAPEPRKPALRLPQAKGWLVHLIPEAAPAGGQLESFIHRPDVQGFVAQAPRAARHLRPLCRMQGIPLPDYLKLPPRPRKPRPATPRARTPRPWPLKDFPPYLRRAIRAWRNQSPAPDPAPEPTRVITPAAAPPPPSPLGPQGFDAPSGFNAPRGFDTPWIHRRRG